MRYLYISFFALIFLIDLNAENSKSIYFDTYTYIDKMLSDSTDLNFRKAVFATENAYLNGDLDYKQINQEIEVLIKLTETVSVKEPIIYKESDKNIVIKHSSLF